MRILAALFTGLALTLASCAPQPAREPAIWRIADADSEIWLYGTVHVLPPDVRWRGPRFEAAFAAADELVTETDTSEAAVETLRALARRYGALPEGETLSARLGPEDRARLARVVADLRLDPAALERLRPWLAALQLSFAHAASKGHSAESGVETVLLAEARAQGKRISYLETPEEQVRVLADLAPVDEVRFLSLTLHQIEEDETTLNALDRAWALGEVEVLGALLDAQWRQAGPAIHEAVIVDRNRDWADAIAERLDGSGRVFVAVGAAHLVGEENVVHLLRERGIEVEGP
jgi:uncharacterized protein YbaP (TraB family)